MLSMDEYVVDVLMRDLVGHDRRPASFLVYLWLAAEQQRQGKAVTISYQQLAESVGISKSSAQAAAGWLARRKLIVVNKAGFTATAVCSVTADPPTLLVCVNETTSVGQILTTNRVVAMLSARGEVDGRGSGRLYASGAS